MKIATAKKTREKRGKKKFEKEVTNSTNKTKSMIPTLNLEYTIPKITAWNGDIATIKSNVRTHHEKYTNLRR